MTVGTREVILSEGDQKTFKEEMQGLTKMAQRMKTLAAKLDDPSSVPSSHTVEEKNWFL